ncbi:MAG: hypothetical protein Q8942_11690 [Bacillota bacterium]|nr:hypothetical protein [Bacillota bacterium]
MRTKLGEKVGQPLVEGVKAVRESCNDLGSLGEKITKSIDEMLARICHIQLLLYIKFTN